MAGMPLTVHDHEIGDELPERAHLVHVGSGPVSGQEAVRDDVARIAAQLRSWAAAEIPFLAIAAGWQLLGRELVGTDGTVCQGAGVFPTRATLTADRRVGEVVATSPFGDLGGFENHGSVTELLDDAEPFARLTHREGAGPGPEGVLVGPSIGTNLHGPLLPMNPAVADALLTTAAAPRGRPPGGGRRPRQARGRSRCTITRRDPPPPRRLAVQVERPGAVARHARRRSRRRSCPPIQPTPQPSARPSHQGRTG